MASRRLILIVSMAVALISMPWQHASAQELNATIKINSNQIQGTDKSVFENLEQALMQFVNDRQWTNLQYQKNERINCSFNITVTKYDNTSNMFSCKAIVQANRPVFNSAYTSTLYKNTDNNFDFEYAQFDQLEFNDEMVSQQLTALFAYYAYLLLGIDLDTFSPMGGTEVLQACLNLVNNAQNLGFTGWEAFNDDRNRFAIINDYLDEGMKPFRQLQYDYYRKGLDEMVTNVERGRSAISEAITTLLKEAHENKPLMQLPLIWTDYKKDELQSIYKGKGTQKEKEAVYEVLSNINASQSNYWDNIKK